MHEHAATSEVELLAHTPLDELRRALEEIALKAARVMDGRDCSVALYQPAQDHLITLANSNPALDTPRARFKLGQGIAGVVGQSLQPLVVPDIAREARFLSLGARDICSMISVPIVGAGSQLLGVITAVSADTNSFAERELMLLGTIADMAALSIVQLVHAHRLQVLNYLGQQLLAATSTEQGFNLLRDSLLTLIPLDLLYLQEAGKEQYPALQWCSPMAVPLHAPKDFSSAAPEGPRLLTVQEAHDLLDQNATAACCGSWLVLPLTASGELLGHLIAGTVRSGAYKTDQIKTLETIGSQMALWMKNQRLYERARAQGERLEAVFGSSSDAILMLSDQVVTRINPAATVLLGLREEECVGRHKDDLLRLLPVDDLLSEDAHLYGIETATGVREIEMFSSAVAVDGVKRTIITLRDITEQRQLDRVKAGFISMVSHELRTPLNSVLGFSDILLTGAAGSINEDQREFLGHIKSSSRHLVQLVNDILDLSRIDAGHFRLNVGPLLPGMLVRQVVAELSGLAGAAQVDLLSEVAPGLPPIQGDARRIEQVLINLVGNALKFTPQGGTVRVRVGAECDHLLFSVLDNGAGIHEEEREKIFERFYQPATTPGLATKGSGLGLTIAKHLVEQHQGRIWLESEVGVGSAFHFSLPILPA